MTPMHFGEHLTIDGYGGNKIFLDNKNLILEILNTLPSLLGMEVLVEPQVVNAPSNDNKDPGGWTGFVIIAESHISIHTFPLRGFVSVDVYSCRNGMDTDFLTKYFKEKFTLKNVETNFIKRGTRYPKDNIY
ncbi:MAG: S-adenosylmethionine decarboxylase [Patescibacteria group bacterium]